MSHPTPGLFGRLERVNVRTGLPDMETKDDTGDILRIDNGAWFSRTRRCRCSADVEEDYGISPEDVMILAFKFGQIKTGEYNGIYVDQAGVSPYNKMARGILGRNLERILAE